MRRFPFFSFFVGFFLWSSSPLSLFFLDVILLMASAVLCPKFPLFSLLFEIPSKNFFFRFYWALIFLVLFVPMHVETISLFFFFFFLQFHLLSSSPRGGLIRAFPGVQPWRPSLVLTPRPPRPYIRFRWSVLILLGLPPIYFWGGQPPLVSFSSKSSPTTHIHRRD